jgi:hypothetical protein
VLNTSGDITTEGANLTHSFMEKYIGSDQSDLGVPVLSMKGESLRSAPPYLACSDYYNEFVRQLKIEVIEGRMNKIIEDGDKVSIEVSAHLRRIAML